MNIEFVIARIRNAHDKACEKLRTTKEEEKKGEKTLQDVAFEVGKCIALFDLLQEFQTLERKQDAKTA